MSDASEHRHELLERVLTGELPEDAPEILELIGREPSIREELERLIMMRNTIAEAARYEDEILAEADALEGAPGEDTVAAFVEARMDERAGQAGRPRRRRLAVALAVAASLMLLLWLREPGRVEVPGGGSSVELGGSGVELLGPEGVVPRTGLRFEWTLEEGDLREFQVVIRGTGIQSPRKPGWTVWIPEDTSTWPERFEWELIAFDGSGQEDRVGQRSVVLSSEE